MSRLRSPLLAGGACLLVITLSGSAMALRNQDKGMKITAHFPRAIALYPHSSVRVMGVPVGQVESVTAQGQTVAVVMRVTKSGVSIPANAEASIVLPALVSDRYLQLGPAYTGGAKMGNNGDIPLARSHAPFEKDDILGALDKVDVALGPNGANKDGAFARLINTGANNLGNGQAEQLSSTLHDLADLVQTLDGDKSQLFGTINQLDTFTQTLSADDGKIRSLYTDLASVSAQLADDRQALAAALKNLSTTFTEVTSLVSKNRANLHADLTQLKDLTDVLAQEKDAIAEVLDTAPLGLSNLATAYNPASQNLDTRNNTPELSGDPNALKTYLCNQLQALGIDCNTIQAVPVPVPTGGTVPAPLPVPLPTGSLPVPVPGLTSSSAPVTGSGLGGLLGALGVGGKG